MLAHTSTTDEIAEEKKVFEGIWIFSEIDQLSRKKPHLIRLYKSSSHLDAFNTLIYLLVLGGKADINYNMHIKQCISQLQQFDLGLPCLSRPFC